jgi:NAD-dependent deacetylase
MDGNQRNILEEFFNSKNIMLLTGAGISAESGLPTFRGEDGYWVAGGKNYHPRELATYETFQSQPDLVWDWYHHRRNLYQKAEPNAGHFAITELQKFFRLNGRNLTLVTQNVDNLHQKAGIEDLYEIHGNIFYMRCSEDCTKKLYKIMETQLGVPKCPTCGENARPHVLWFDEFYDEEFYNFRTVLEKGENIDALMIVGSTLQTNLPRRLFEFAYFKELPIIEINNDPIGLEKYGVLEIKGKSGEVLPEIVKKISI